jgi:hypothetical protein
MLLNFGHQTKSGVFNMPASSLTSLVDHPGYSSQRGALEPIFQQLLLIDPNSIFIDSITNKNERQYTCDCGFSQYTVSSGKHHFQLHKESLTNHTQA